VVQAVVDAVGADRVGIRISPFTGFLDAVDSHPYALHTYLCEELNKFGLAYVHMVGAAAPTCCVCCRGLNVPHALHATCWLSATTTCMC
jgi:2,4-dienoyl-CoA reductase-like NADH-dependent reductase (Old Yellow Enzyme family)